MEAIVLDNGRRVYKPNRLKLEYKLHEKKILLIRERILASLYVACIYLLIRAIIAAIVFAADVHGGATTYQYLADSIFGEHTGTEGAQAQVFLKYAKMILSWALPFMTVFATTFMVISMAATVVYLVRPPWWDEVHLVKVARRQIKGNGNPIELVKEVWKQTDGIKGFIMATILPDVKALAFEDADEIGPDGKASLSHYLKYKMPTHMALVAFIMCINDQTFLKFYSQAGNAGAYIVRLAADYDYAVVVKSLVEAGNDYDPGYGTVGVSRETRNKRVLFNNIYKSIKQYNGFVPDKRTNEYLQTMGANVQAWIEEELSKKVNLDADKMAVRAVVQQNDAANYSEGTTFSRNLSSIAPGGDTAYVIVTITFGDTERGLVYHDTSYASAWEPQGTLPNIKSVSLDISKIGALQGRTDLGDASASVVATVQYINSGTGTNGKASNEVKAGAATVTISGMKATIKAPGDGTILGVNAVITVNNKKTQVIMRDEAVYWKNPSIDQLLKTTDQSVTKKP